MTETCAFHETHDEAGEPTGEPCGAVATHMIVWRDGTQRWSPACSAHTLEGERGTPPHRVVAVENWATFSRRQLQG